MSLLIVVNNFCTLGGLNFLSDSPSVGYDISDIPAATTVQGLATSSSVWDNADITKAKVNGTERPPFLYYCGDRPENAVGTMLDTLKSVFPKYSEVDLRNGAFSEGLPPALAQYLYKGPSNGGSGGGNPYDIS